MAINDPILAVGPTKRRDQVLDQPVHTRAAAPTDTERVPDGNGSYIDNPPLTPSIEGQLVFHTGTEANLRFAAAYVAVDIEGTLTWKPTANRTPVNGYTGKAFDPIFDQ